MCTYTKKHPDLPNQLYGNTQPHHVIPTNEAHVCTQKETITKMERHLEILHHLHI